MEHWTQAFGALLGAYVIGCLTTGYYLVRAIKGVDIRAEGSGSAGARNVSRVLGKSGFLLTVIGDAAKGALAVWVVRRVVQNDDIAALALVSVTAGHVWPLQLRFKGGKGVATSLGGLCLYDWRLACAYVAIFLVGLLIVRRTMLPGLIAFAGIPVAAMWLGHNAIQISALTLIGALILYAHRANLVEEIPALAARRSSQKNAGPSMS